MRKTTIMNYRKLHVAIFVSTLEVGGAERVAVTLANEMVEKGIRIDLIVMSIGGEMQKKLNSRVNVVDLNTKRGRFSFFALVAYIMRNKPTAILSLLTVPNMLLGLTKLVPLRNRPLLIGSEHSYDSDIYRRNDRNVFLYAAYSIAARIAYRMLDLNIAVSEGVKQRMVERRQVKSRKIKVMPNPIDLRDIAVPHGQTPGLRPRIKLLAVGRLNILKDYETMFRAVDIIRRDFAVVLNVLGEGEERACLATLISDLNLEENIKLIGNVQETSTWYQGADVLVLSSISEGFSMVIVEALAHGLPVVSTDCLSGPNEILTELEYGALVPVGDYAQLAATIINVLSKNHDRGLLYLRAKEYDSRIVC